MGEAAQNPNDSGVKFLKIFLERREMGLVFSLTEKCDLYADPINIGWNAFSVNGEMGWEAGNLISTVEISGWKARKRWVE